jgi:hypothetical protein
MHFLNEKIAWLAGELSSEQFGGLTGLSADDTTNRVRA